MRSRSFQQTMLRLALIAALLMALMPSLMRLGGHVHGGHDVLSSGGATHAMHAMHGHAGMPFGSGLPLPPHGGGAGFGHDDDCAYCPLLASLALAAFVLLVLPPQRAPAWNVPARIVAPRMALRHPCGLGSRGPPLAA